MANLLKTFFLFLTLKIKFAGIFIIIFVISTSKFAGILSFKLIGSAFRKCTLNSFFGKTNYLLGQQKSFARFISTIRLANTTVFFSVRWDFFWKHLIRFLRFQKYFEVILIEQSWLFNIEVPWVEFWTGIQSEQIRVIPGHFETFRKRFWILFDANRFKINLTHSSSIESFNPNESELKFNSCSDLSKPNLQFESIRGRDDSD